ncbi:Mu-like prophage FluMu protein gp28 [Actinobacillus equuli]|nr:Mu-like prophage FluMu protein gp28 [Actinobacillus equuli]
MKDGLYERICLRTNRAYSKEGELQWEAEIRASYGDDAAEELDCIPKNSGGKWLSRALIEKQMHSHTPLIRKEMSLDFEQIDEPVRAKEIAQWLQEEIQPL